MVTKREPLAAGVGGAKLLMSQFLYLMADETSDHL